MRSGVCGAPRTSICELAANDLKVNSVADRKSAVWRFQGPVRLRKTERFVIPLRDLPASGPARTPPMFRDAAQSYLAATVAPKQHPTEPWLCLLSPRLVVAATCAGDAIQRFRIVLEVSSKVESTSGNSFVLEGKPHLGYDTIITGCIHRRACCRCSVRTTGYLDQGYTLKLTRQGGVS